MMFQDEEKFKNKIDNGTPCKHRIDEAQVS
jgi:hypothetical protein